MRGFTIIFSFCLIKLGISTCPEVASDEHGVLTVEQTEDIDQEICIGNFIFTNKETKETFCLKKDSEADKRTTLKCGNTTCVCGQENKPTEPQARITDGGQEVSENQYPWHTLILMTKDSVVKEYCGGSLISQRVVLTAAHCFKKNHQFYVGFGLHKVPTIMGMSTKSEFFKKNFYQVAEQIPHPDYNDKFNKKNLPKNENDFGLLILKTPIKMSKTISPVCLPRQDEVDILEKKENILTGYGKHKIWFQEYEKLLGKKLKRTPITDIFHNQSIDKSEKHTTLLKEFLKTFKQHFPGMDECIDNDNFEFTCQMTNERMDKIVDNIGLKLKNSGRKLDEEEVKLFLDQTRKKVLPLYQDLINKWPLKISREDITRWVDKFTKSLGITRGMMELVFESLQGQEGIESQFKFVIEQLPYVQDSIQHPVLRRAKGTFLPWSACRTFYNERQCSLEHPSKIMVQRSSIKEGAGCQGDSGGAAVVKHDGNFIVVGVLSYVYMDDFIFWPPHCACCVESKWPEMHGRVIEAMSWIEKVVRDKNLVVNCPRK